MDKLSHIWVGQFGKDAPQDYFNEVYTEDDFTPISKFVAEQDEFWIDHDFMIVEREEKLVPIEKFVYNVSPRCRELVLARCKELNITEANITVILPEDEVEEPQTITKENYSLYYLGLYDNTYREKTLEERIAEAEAGDSGAQAVLGELYIFPPPKQRDIRDYEKAEYWLLQAAEKGETTVYNRLYHLYKGKYSPQHYNPEKAFYYIHKAAQMGSRTDQLYCAEMYANGEGVAQSKVQAMKWYFLSRSQYDTDSYNRDLNELKSKMTPEEIRQAKTLALEWIDQKNYNPDYFTFERDPLPEY